MDSVSKATQGQPEKTVPARYLIKGDEHVIEALGFLKDWVTALVTLQTAAIGAIGVYLGLKSGGGVTGVTPQPSIPLLVSSGILPAGFVGWAAYLQVLAGLLVCLTVAAFLVSIFCGLGVLYMLPGSAQRIPHADADVFSIRTLDNGKPIGYWAQRHWAAFAVGMVLFGLFIVLRMLIL